MEHVDIEDVEAGLSASSLSHLYFERTVDENSVRRSGPSELAESCVVDEIL
jgi:hypothetical protein